MLHDSKFWIPARSVCDWCIVLTTKHAQKLRDEKRASGFEAEKTELDILLKGKKTKLLEKVSVNKL